MKGYTIFPKATISLKPHQLIVLCHNQDTHCSGVFPLCREAVGVFYSPSRLDKTLGYSLGTFFTYSSILSTFLFAYKIIFRDHHQLCHPVFPNSMHNEFSFSEKVAGIEISTVSTGWWLLTKMMWCFEKKKNIQSDHSFCFTKTLQIHLFDFAICCIVMSSFFRKGKIRRLINFYFKLILSVKKRLRIKWKCYWYN